MPPLVFLVSVFSIVQNFRSSVQIANTLAAVFQCCIICPLLHTVWVYHIVQRSDWVYRTRERSEVKRFRCILCKGASVETFNFPVFHLII